MSLKLHNLPAVRGRYRENVPLAGTTWFRVGGSAEVEFKPADREDLAGFVRALHSIARSGIVSDEAISASQSGEIAMPPSAACNDRMIPITVLGAASNVVIRDGGIDGVLVRLGRGFNQLAVIARSDSDEAISGSQHEIAAPPSAARNDVIIEAGAACLDVNVAQFALQQGLSGLEFLSGIPGAIGGALRMNAGAYGSEIKDVLIKAEAVTPEGEIIELTCEEMGFSYRHCDQPEGVIFTRAWLRAAPDDPARIAARMQEIAHSRSSSQPVRARTGGSTFRNPPGHKAWELIDAAGCRGMMIGGAQVSEKHCNFLINTGVATAADLEQLVKQIIRQVKNHSGIALEPEIKFIGKAQ